MNRQHQIAALTLGLAAGIIIAANSPRATAHWQLFALAAFVLIALAFFVRRLTVLSLIPLSIFGGIFYYQIWHSATTHHSIAADIGQVVQVQGRVDGTPYWGSDGSYILRLTNLVANGQPMAGSLRVKTLLSNGQEGYTVATGGKLYHTAAGEDAQLIYADTQVVSTRRPWLVRVKTAYTSGLERALPEPASLYMEGIVIGNRSGLPTDIQDELNRIGLAHLVAISGYNLTILIMIFHKMIRTRWKWLLLVSSLWIILGFVLITGAVASIVRAGVMSTLFLLFQHYGKRLSAVYALLLTALITILIRPAYLLSDIGWQLSFTSLAGIVLLSDPIRQMFPARFKLLPEIFAVTLAAQIFTLPLIAYHFGQLSLIAPLSNLLVMPFVPVLMGAGMAAGLVGLVLPGLAGALFAPLNALVSWQLDLIRYLSDLHFAALDIRTPSLRLLLSYYVIAVGAVTIRYLPGARIRYNKMQHELDLNSEQAI